MIISNLGVGTFKPEPYKDENYLFSFKDSIIEAVKNGCNFIDCAINYRYQQSEREVKDALDELFSQNIVNREQLVLCSKGGFIPLNYPFPHPYKWIEENIIEQDLATKDEIIEDQHCLSAKFIEWSLNCSLKNLNVETIDIYYLHNVEMELGYISYEALLQKVKECFIVLERLCDEGKIRYYGIASWNGFLNEPTFLEYLSLNDFVKIAKEVGGEKNRFKFVQSPYNLAKPHAYTYQNQQLDDELYYSLIQACIKLGLNFIASSSLLQMNLFKKEFSNSISSLLGSIFASDVQKALQFSRSANGVVSALFSSIEPLHVKHNMEINLIPKTKIENYRKIFSL
ncbi:MAG: aldo/keto reductase [Campylobacterales bacterium]|nr:aldo/keto reductase [Campylobacterales bacterium]